MKLKNKIGNLIEIDWANDLHELQPDNIKVPININYLKDSILKHGFALPFAVWNDNGKYYCIDGHTRKQILLELIADGIQVPTKLKAFEILAKDRTEAIKILVEVYNQKHNPFAEEVLTEWLEMEEIELESLENVNILPFEAEKKITSNIEEDNFEFNDGLETDIVIGDLFEIGKHRILCGDSTNFNDVEKLMNSEKADMVFTDPPYGYRYESNHQNKHKELLNDDVILNFLPNTYLFTKENVPYYIFCGWQTLSEWIDQVKNNNLNLKNIIIWKKNNWSMGDLKGSYAGQYEVILFGHKGRVEINGGRESDVWEFDRVPPNLHPTMKPIPLIEKALFHSSKEENIVLDLFLGSGSTMVASHQMNRKCYGMELYPIYCDVVIRRMLKLDPTLTIKRNGVIETDKWLNKIND